MPAVTPTQRLKNQWSILEKNWHPPGTPKVRTYAEMKKNKYSFITPLAVALYEVPGAIQPLMDAGVTKEDLNIPPGRFKAWRGWTPLMAAFCKNPAWVEPLLALGGDPAIADDEGTSIFHLINDQNIHLVPLLIAHGASLNAVSQRDNPLTQVAGGHPHLIASVVGLGADINQKTPSGTALMRAVTTSPAATRILLELGADPNITGYENRTPLMEAVRNWSNHPAGEQVAIIDLLLQHGADPDLKEDYGRTAVQMDGPKVLKDHLRQQMRIWADKARLESALPAAVVESGRGGQRL
jgi:hypothetical protein